MCLIVHGQNWTPNPKWPPYPACLVIAAPSSHDTSISADIPLLPVQTPWRCIHPRPPPLSAIPSQSHAAHVNFPLSEMLLKRLWVCPTPFCCSNIKNWTLSWSDYRSISGYLWLVCSRAWESYFIGREKLRLASYGVMEKWILGWFRSCIISISWPSMSWHPKQTCHLGPKPFFFVPHTDSTRMPALFSQSNHISKGPPA